MAKLNCNNCIHNEVCYKCKNVNTEYADTCGDYIDVDMIVYEIKKILDRDIKDVKVKIRKVIEDKENE